MVVIATDEQQHPTQTKQTKMDVAQRKGGAATFEVAKLDGDGDEHEDAVQVTSVGTDTGTDTGMNEGKGTDTGTDGTGSGSGSADDKKNLAKLSKKMALEGITPVDVLLGRGGGIVQTVGNVRYRAIINNHRQTYTEAKKHMKLRIAKQCVQLVYRAGGRFMDWDADEEKWVPVTGMRPVEKTSQALREHMKEQARQASAALAAAAAAAARSKSRSSASRTRRPTAKAAVAAAQLVQASRKAAYTNTAGKSSETKRKRKKSTTAGPKPQPFDYFKKYSKKQGCSHKPIVEPTDKKSSTLEKSHGNIMKLASHMMKSQNLTWKPPTKPTERLSATVKADCDNEVEVASLATKMTSKKQGMKRKRRTSSKTINTITAEGTTPKSAEESARERERRAAETLQSRTANSVGQIDPASSEPNPRDLGSNNPTHHIEAKSHQLHQSYYQQQQHHHHHHQQQQQQRQEHHRHQLLMHGHIGHAGGYPPVLSSVQKQHEHHVKMFLDQQKARLGSSPAEEDKTFAKLLQTKMQSDMMKMQNKSDDPSLRNNAAQLPPPAYQVPKLHQAVHAQSSFADNVKHAQIRAIHDSYMARLNVQELSGQQHSMLPSSGAVIIGKPNSELATSKDRAKVDDDTTAAQPNNKHTSHQRLQQPLQQEFQQQQQHQPQQHHVMQSRYERELYLRHCQLQQHILLSQQRPGEVDAESRRTQLNVHQLGALQAHHSRLQKLQLSRQREQNDQLLQKKQNYPKSELQDASFAHPAIQEPPNRAQAVNHQLPGLSYVNPAKSTPTKTEIAGANHADLSLLAKNHALAQRRHLSTAQSIPQGHVGAFAKTPPSGAASKAKSKPKVKLQNGFLSASSLSSSSPSGLSAAQLAIGHMMQHAAGYEKDSAGHDFDELRFMMEKSKGSSRLAAAKSVLMMDSRMAVNRMLKKSATTVDDDAGSRKRLHKSSNHCWDGMFTELQAFFNKYGHCFVAETQTELFDWMCHQRLMYREIQNGVRQMHSKDAERFELLRMVDFPFELK